MKNILALIFIILFLGLCNSFCATKTTTTKKSVTVVIPDDSSKRGIVLNRLYQEKLKKETPKQKVTSKVVKPSKAIVR